MFELISINNNSVVLNEETSLRISMILKEEVEIKIFKEKLKKELLRAFEETGKRTYEDNNIRIICKKGTTKTTVDSKRLKQERPDIYNEFSKTSESSPSISMEIV